MMSWILGLASGAMLVLCFPVQAEYKVTPAIKPWHVTQISADVPVCDSPTSYAFNVTWKPVMNTWQTGQLPIEWHHYAVQTNNCAVTSEIICNVMCTVRASGCSTRLSGSWMRIFTWSNVEHTGKGSYMQIGGMPRPPLTLVGRQMQCVG